MFSSQYIQGILLTHLYSNRESLFFPSAVSGSPSTCTASLPPRIRSATRPMFHQTGMSPPRNSHPTLQILAVRWSTMSSARQNRATLRRGQRRWSSFPRLMDSPSRRANPSTGANGARSGGIERSRCLLVTAGWQGSEMRDVDFNFISSFPIVDAVTPFVTPAFSPLLLCSYLLLLVVCVLHFCNYS